MNNTKIHFIYIIYHVFIIEDIKIFSLNKITFVQKIVFFIRKKTKFVKINLSSKF